MRKLIYIYFLGAALYSCKKTSENVAMHTPAQDTATLPEPEPTPTALAEIQELPPQKISELINTKNDTLYITNFFATWCGPCVREMPLFAKKMESLKGSQVKFTFVSLDAREDWDSQVKPFAEKMGINGNVILLDGEKLPEDFFEKNFSGWDGTAIPFTHFRKGNETKEFLGGISEGELNTFIQSFK